MVERTFSNHGIEAVVHAGALHKPDIARYPATAFVDVNLTGTLNLLEAAVAVRHDRFVFTSTTSGRAGLFEIFQIEINNEQRVCANRLIMRPRRLTA
jgi:nucleoside-diphosphate-sugar epimerase